MKDESEISSQQSVESIISSFLESDLARELGEFRLSYFKPLKNWSIKIRDELFRIKKDDDYYRNKIELINRKLPELQQIIEEKLSRDWYEDFTDSILNAAGKLPDEIIEEQSDFHLSSSEDDSPIIKTGKFFKRLTFTIKRDSPTRTVYPRQLFLDHILKNNDWIEKLAGHSFEKYSEFLDTFLRLEEAVADAESADYQQEEFPGDFTSQIIDNLEERILSVLEELNKTESSNEDYVKKCIDPITSEFIKKSRISGTFQYSQKKRVIDKSFISSHLSKKVNKNQQANWVKYVQSQFNDLKVNIEIAVYGLSASNAKSDIKDKVHDFFRDAFYLPMGAAVKIIKEAQHQISELKELDNSRKKLDSIRQILNEDLEKNILESMQNIQRVMQPVQDIQKKIGDLQAEARHFSESIELAVKREKNHPLPVIELNTLHWQSQAARYMKEEVIRKLDPSQQGFDQLVARGKTIAEEAIQITDVNLQAAIESISRKKSSDSESEEYQSPKDISLEGLTRAVNTLGAGIKEIREKQDSYGNLVDTLIPEALKTLSGNMLRREFQHLKMHDKALLVRQQALNWKDKISSKLAVIFEKIEIGYRFLSRKFRDYSRVIKPYLGIRSDDIVTIREKRNLAEYLASSRSKVTIPFVYERLFNLDFPIDHRFYVPPSNGIQLVESSFNEWKRDLSTNVVVVGEKGSGKTTLIRFAEKQCLNEEEPIELTFNKTFIKERELLIKLCSALGFKPVETKEEFISKVEKIKKRSVIIVENLQNISIRNINGFEALEAFWVIMTSTMGKLFWVVSCSRYSWEFFIKISEADQYFSHIIQTDKLNENELKNAILSRHKSTGYELFFEPDESIRKSRAYKKLLGDQEQSQELIRKHFFSKLYKVSEGNISIGMILWLKSIKQIDDHQFVFGPIEVTDIDKLEVPSVEVLFTLATIIQHDVLTTDQIAMALDDGSSNSSLMLARLKTKGIILETENGYRLNHLVYRQVIRILKQRNIIH
ncbi:AAA family ATPase [Rhodohalobacter sulfatireducens]|uniref:ATP-binding protein n=1 Tax=Rhodohalobacter sulfatireducens TaxID=2911366 RepID=A0ABS9KJ54_9BACT|nr:ATP-binding protein [Rhodohalobacter sulfatireducens]MCG2590890.1 ATP-binding protein [Rhodohalobacter sulfatireducens]